MHSWARGFLEWSSYHAGWPTDSSFREEHGKERCKSCPRYLGPSLVPLTVIYCHSLCVPNTFVTTRQIFCCVQRDPSCQIKGLTMHVRLSSLLCDRVFATNIWKIRFKIFLFFKLRRHTCVTGCGSEYRWPWSLQALDWHRPGVAGPCESPYMASENKTWDLCKAKINEKCPPAPKLQCFMTFFVPFMKLLPHWNMVIWENQPKLLSRTHSCLAPE